MIETRQACNDDVRTICAFDHVAAQSEERRTFIQRSVGSGNTSVAVDGGEVVGYVVLEYTFYANGFISMLYVHSEYRKRGIGSALLRHAEKLCTTRKLFTSTNESNRPMQALLQRAGFKPSGRIENLDEDDPELVFLKDLGA